MKYYTMNEFTTTVKKSRSTVNRFYTNHKSLKGERKEQGRDRLIPEAHIKYFSLELMIENEVRLRMQIEQMKKLLNYIRNGDDLQNYLWGMEWDLFGTISYSNIMGALTCVSKMNKFYDQLRMIAGSAEVRLFFTTEAYLERNGHHNHFVLHCSDKTILPEIQRFIQSYFKRNQVDLQPYNENDTGIFYITKHRTKGTDWDLLL